MMSSHENLSFTSSKDNINLEIKQEEVPLEVNEAVDTVFESINCHFSILVFFKQFIIHLTGPFLLFLTNPWNQGFFSVDNDFFAMNHATPALFMIAFISAYLSPDPNISSQGALWVPALYFVLHKFQVAVKYACLSPNEYDKFMTADIKTSNKYQTQMMLLTGWLNKNPSSVEFEMSAASMRCGVDIIYLNFYIQNPTNSEDSLSQFRNWKALLLGKDRVTDDDHCEDLIECEDGSYHVPVFTVCLALLRYCESLKGGMLTYAPYIESTLMLINISIPFLLLPFQKDGLNLGNPWTIVFYASATILNCVYSGIIFNFMTICVYDVVRQRNFFTTLREMIRISDLSHETKHITSGVETIGRSNKDRRQSKADVHISRSEAIVKHLRKGILLHQAEVRSNSRAESFKKAASRHGSRRSSIFKRKSQPNVPAFGARPSQVHATAEPTDQVVPTHRSDADTASSTTSPAVSFVERTFENDFQLQDATDEPHHTQPQPSAAQSPIDQLAMSTKDPSDSHTTLSSDQWARGGSSNRHLNRNTSVSSTHSASDPALHANEMRRNSVILGQINVQQNEVAVIPRLDTKNDRNIVAWVSKACCIYYLCICILL